jgi:predicted nucleotidyltransferase
MDTEELLRLLKENKVDFIIIGASAFPVYGYARATLDIDIFVRPELDNIHKVIVALNEFGYDLMNLSAQDLLENKVLIRQYMVEADIHPFVKGVTFGDLWKNKIKANFGGIEVYFPSLEDMIKMKKTAGRARDLEDLKILIKIREKNRKAENNSKSK